MTSKKIGVVGLGYVGLPVALGFADKFEGTIGFDIDSSRVKDLIAGLDRTGEISAKVLESTSLTFSNSKAALRSANVYVVCVPTPIHPDLRPDLGAIESASKIVGTVLSRGDIVIYESTVYPGLTEEFCGPILEHASGLRRGDDFKLGYSPERINPGDGEHTFASIVKVVAGEDEATTKVMAELYGTVVSAGVHIAPSIKVAECAKVLENTQRDLNIALMNELAVICDLLNIRTRDVLDAAETKWNFLKFTPGLVGGHCIGVDPYYLTTKAVELGYHPEVILSGRRVNDSMGPRIANRIVKMLAQSGRPLSSARVGVLGITFKENVSDVRNSRVPDIVRELNQFGMSVLIADPHVDPSQVAHKCSLEICQLDQMGDLDALVLAVPHKIFLADKARLVGMLKSDAVFIDIKSAFPRSELPEGVRYWSL